LKLGFHNRSSPRGLCRPPRPFPTTNPSVRRAYAGEGK
jgi:hypothetical protein